MEVKRFPHLHDRVVEVVTNLLLQRLPSTNEMVTSSIYKRTATNTFHVDRQVCFQISICFDRTEKFGRT